MRVFLLLTLQILPLSAFLRAAELPPATHAFLENRCFDCHDDSTKKGDLNLEALKFDPNDPASFGRWVTVYDRVHDGEMPPKKKSQPAPDERAAFLKSIAEPLLAANAAKQQREGRTVFRRLNRTEYEYTLRDLLGLPHLEVREMLPGDGEAHGFDTVGKALNLSYVQLVKYLEAADHALDRAIVLAAPGNGVPAPVTLRKPFTKLGRFNNKNGETRALGEESRIILRQPNSAQTGWHAWGIDASADGMHRLRLSCHGLFWDAGVIKPADRPHVISLYGSLNNSKRLLGTFDVPADISGVLETEVWMREGEYLILHAHSLDDRNGPIQTTKQGKPYSGPGIALDWMEVQGPLLKTWPLPSVARLVGDLPVKKWTPESGLLEPASANVALGAKKAGKNSAPFMVVSAAPEADAEKLLRRFMERAFRRPVPDGEVKRYLALVSERLEKKHPFHEAMRTGFKAVLCSPDFLFFQEEPSGLDNYALASRLSYFLWKSMPDATLFALAAQGRLSDPQVLRAQTERLLADPRSERFVEDFLAQWLELRRIGFTEPDRQLYPEFEILLQESMIAETRAYFTTMLRENLSIDHLVRSDFVLVNASLAALYDIPGVEGLALRKVGLPAGSPRGGILTQGSVLKITANGTTTSPVTRGVWILDRLLGKPVPPPPPAAGSIEPDVRGTTTVRELLAKHSTDISCASCHSKIDPPGFALESFDPMGGWRTRYRSMEKGDPVNGQVAGSKVKYKLGLPVDASGESSGGEPFKDIHDFRKLLLRDREQLARNMAERLMVYATGAGIEFADRPEVERLLAATKANDYGLRSLVHSVVQSGVFRRK